MPLPLLLAEPVTRLRLSKTEKAPENYRVFAEQVRRTTCSVLVLCQWQYASKFCMSLRRCRTKCSKHLCQPVHLRALLYSRKCEHLLRTEPRISHNHSLAAMSLELSTRVLSTRQIKDRKSVV